MSDADVLRGYDPAAYERPSVTVDLVLFGVRGRRLCALLTPRDQPPHAGRWALPGGFVGIREDLDAAAARVLREKVGIVAAHLEQLYTFGAVDRDPRMRVVTVAYLALLREPQFEDAIRAGAVGAATLDGEPLQALDAKGASLELAFDHRHILSLARGRMRGKIDYSDVAFALLPERFTLRALQDVHEAVLGATLNKPAFRRRMLDRGGLAATGAREEDASHRPAELYRVVAAEPSAPDAGG